MQYFSEQTLFVNCNVRKKETAKSAICNSSSSIITGNVIRFDNNFLFFGNFFVKLKDQNTSKFFANHLRRGGRFCEISSKVAKYKRIQGECCCCKDYWRNSLFYYYYTIFFYWCNFSNSNVVKRFSKNSHAASIARLTELQLTVIIIIYRNV